MNQINGSENIYYIHKIEEKSILEINHYKIINNSISEFDNDSFCIDLSMLNCDYLSHKLFQDYTFIILGTSCIMLFPNIIKDKNFFLSSKIAFHYENKYKINFFQMEEENKFILSNGKSVLLIERNNNKLSCRTFERLNNLSIIKIISYEQKKDKFSGYLISLKCLVSYEEKDSNSNLNIQNLILPQFEDDIIVDFKLIYFPLDNYQFSKCFKKELFIFSYKNSIFYHKFFGNEENKETTVLEEFKSNHQENCIDKISIAYNYCFIFVNNKTIYIYEIDKNFSLSYKNKIQFNENNQIIIKIKVFYVKNTNKAFIFYIDFLHNQYLFSFDILTGKDKTKEEIKTNNNLYFSKYNFLINKIVINDIPVIYVNKMHCSLLKNNFYNKIFINIKIFETNDDKEKINIMGKELALRKYILLLTNYSTLEIYNFDSNNQSLTELIYLIHLDIPYKNLVDYIMINKNNLLLLSINTKTEIMNLKKLFLSKEKNNEKNLTNLLEINKAYNKLYFIKEFQKLFISSNYGEISVYEMDFHGNLNFVEDFNYGLPSSEVINIKNTLSEDIYSKLFLYDLLKKKLKSFHLLRIEHFLKYKENDLFFFHLVVFLFKGFIILFVIMESKYILANKVLFGKQVKIEKDFPYNKNPFEFILKNLKYDMENHFFDFSSEKIK